MVTGGGHIVKGQNIHFEQKSIFYNSWACWLQDSRTCSRLTKFCFHPYLKHNCLTLIESTKGNLEDSGDPFSERVMIALEEAIIPLLKE